MKNWTQPLVGAGLALLCAASVTASPTSPAIEPIAYQGDGDVPPPPPPPERTESEAPVPTDGKTGRSVRGRLVEIGTKRRAVEKDVATAMESSRMLEWLDELEAAAEEGTDLPRILDAIRGTEQAYRYFLSRNTGLLASIDGVRRDIQREQRRVNEKMADQIASRARSERKQRIVELEERLAKTAQQIQALEENGEDAAIQRTFFAQTMEILEIERGIDQNLDGKLDGAQVVMAIRETLQGIGASVDHTEHILTLAQSALQGELELLELAGSTVVLAIDLEELRREGDEEIFGASGLQEFIGRLAGGRGALRETLREISGNTFTAHSAYSPGLNEQISHWARRSAARTVSNDPGPSGR